MWNFDIFWFISDNICSNLLWFSTIEVEFCLVIRRPIVIYLFKTY